MSTRGFVVGDRILGQAADTHADWCAAYGQAGYYRLVGATAIGKLHLRDVRPRDDAFAARSAGPWLAVAVADGLGSRKQSRYGASFAVEALCEHLLREVAGGSTPSIAKPAEDAATVTEATEPVVEKGEPDPASTAPKEGVEGAAGRPPSFDDPVTVAPTAEKASAFGTLTWHWLPPVPEPSEADTPVTVAPTDLRENVRSAFQRTRQGLDQYAAARGVPVGEFGCTLLGLLLNTDTGAVAAGHIGDGLVAALHPERGAFPLVEAPSRGEVGETYVLTQRDWEKYLACTWLPPEETLGIIDFFLMTDGVADDCTHPPPANIFERWARDMDREVRKEGPLSQTACRVLSWLANYEVRGSWDDRTLVIVQRDAELPAPNEVAP